MAQGVNYPFAQKPLGSNNVPQYSHHSHTPPPSYTAPPTPALNRVPSNITRASFSTSGPTNPQLATATSAQSESSTSNPLMDWFTSPVAHTASVDSTAETSSASDGFFKTHGLSIVVFLLASIVILKFIDLSFF